MFITILISPIGVEVMIYSRQCRSADYKTYNILTYCQVQEWHLDGLSDFHLISASVIVANISAPVITFY